jgi:hypothetical protein
LAATDRAVVPHRTAHLLEATVGPLEHFECCHVSAFAESRHIVVSCDPILLEAVLEDFVTFYCFGFSNRIEIDTTKGNCARMDGINDLAKRCAICNVFHFVVINAKEIVDPFEKLCAANKVATTIIPIGFAIVKCSSFGFGKKRCFRSERTSLKRVMKLL